MRECKEDLNLANYRTDRSLDSLRIQLSSRFLINFEIRNLIKQSDETC